MYLESCGGVVHDGELGEAVGTGLGLNLILSVAIQSCPRLAGELCVLVRCHHHRADVSQQTCTRS